MSALMLNIRLKECSGALCNVFKWLYFFFNPAS